MPNPMAAMGLAQGGAAAMARLANPMAMKGRLPGGFLPAMGMPRMSAPMLAQNRMMPMMAGKPKMLAQIDSSEDISTEDE